MRRHAHTKGILFLFALLGALLALAPAAGAATFTVTTTADSGAGSLRQAITDANAAGTGNTIAFAIPGPGPHVIAPASAMPALITTTPSSTAAPSRAATAAPCR